MTDGPLMDADCIHGNTWWECRECFPLTEFCPLCVAGIKHPDTPEAHAHQRAHEAVARQQAEEYRSDRGRGEYDDDPIPVEDER